MKQQGHALPLDLSYLSQFQAPNRGGNDDRGSCGDLDM